MAGPLGAGRRPPAEEAGRLQAPQWRGYLGQSRAGYRRSSGGSMLMRKKLIEVSIPLEAINAASAREKSIRHGHPSTLHLWWARRPLAACRAVLFAQLVDDPSSWPERFDNDDAKIETERKRLHKVIADIVEW